MITKTTLKKLEKAKFPQYIDGILIPNPNLSDLIDACALGFNKLIYKVEINKKGRKTEWEAVPNKKLRKGKKNQTAKTPEEALAKLWLELIRK